MHLNKHFLFIVGAPALLVLVIIAAGVYRFNFSNDGINIDNGKDGVLKYEEAQNVEKATDESATVPDVANTDAGRRVGAPTSSNPPTGKLKVANFSGKLEKVDTSCFSDGECYVVVAGKHVTAVRGWSQETVGSTLGVEGFGDLQSHIGETVEVYAKDNGDSTYTLYGSEGFYIKLSGGSASTGGTKGIAVGEPNPNTPKATVGKGCVVGGCSAQLCLDASQGDMATTCEYTASYACYQTATCEKQQSGQCGWTKTPELSECLISSDDGGKPQVQ